MPADSVAWKAVDQYCENKEGLRPDPRTTLLAVLVINIVALARFNMAGSLLAVLVILGALMVSRAYRAAIIFTAAQVFLVFLILVPSRVYPTSFTAFLTVLGFWFFKLCAVMGIAFYAIHVLVPGELVAALRQMRVPISITVSITVMLRFIPLVYREYQAVREAMALRGLQMGWRAMAHPLRYLEFILVPLLSSCARTADEMTAAGVVRGLGSKIRPSTIIPLRFSRVDFIWIVVLILLVVGAALVKGVSIASGGMQ